MNISPEQKLESAEVQLELYRAKVLNNLNSSTNFRNIERFQEQQEIVKELTDNIISNK